jgi:hypothetical protein
VLASSLPLGCSETNVTTRVASSSVVELVREHFMHDQAVRWLSAGLPRLQLRTELADAGYRFDGIESQGRQGADVDGFSSSTIVNGVPIPMTALTFIFPPGSERAVGMTVLQLDPRLRDPAMKLLTFSLDSVEAATSVSPTGRLHFLGVERVDRTHLLRIMMRVDGIQNEIYSVMYAMIGS